MLKRVTLITATVAALAIGVSATGAPVIEDGWITLAAGQSVSGIRYDQSGAIVVNNELLMGCVHDPQDAYDTEVYVSPPSPHKGLRLVVCWNAGGREAYVIDVRNNRVASRDVVPKHWLIMKWVSWSPDERFALVAAAGEVTDGDMAFVDLRTNRVEEIHFKKFTKNPGSEQNEIQDFDPNGVAWVSDATFSLRLDVRCNPYDGDESCLTKVLRSFPARVNLNPFGIGYGSIGQTRTARASRRSYARKARASLPGPLGSGKRFLLTRYDLRREVQGISIDGSPEHSVGADVTIPSVDVERIVRYISAQSSDPGRLLVEIYKLPLTDDMYYAFTLYGFDFVFLLRKNGEEITEVNRMPNDVGCMGGMNSVFFVGDDRSLIVTSYNAEDGAFCGNYAFEYKDGTLRALGTIPVYDGAHGEGSWHGHNPMGYATAEYRDNSYHVTMRGEGNLYLFTAESGSSDSRDKKLAPKKSPVTFLFDGKAWRLSTSRKTGRR